MKPKAVTLPVPSMFVVIPVEGRPWVGSTHEPSELAGLVEWIVSRAEAEPAVRELLNAALPFVGW